MFTPEKNDLDLEHPGVPVGCFLWGYFGHQFLSLSLVDFLFAEVYK